MFFRVSSERLYHFFHRDETSVNYSPTPVNISEFVERFCNKWYASPYMQSRCRLLKDKK